MKSAKSIVERTDDKLVLKILSEQAPVGVCIMQDRRFCYVNSYLSTTTGYAADELVGKDSLEIVVPEDREMVNENTVKMLKGELLSPYQFRVVCKDGNIIWVMATVKSIQYHGRRATLGNYMEITEHKQIDDAVRQSEEDYRALCEQSPAGVSIMQDGKFCYVNSRFPIAIGYTVHELVGKDSLEIVVPQDREMVVQNTIKMLKRELLSPYQFRATCKDGTIVWVMATVKSIQYRGRRATLGNYMEITGRKQMEEALKENEERYRELADSITDVFFAMDEHLRYTYWNKASEVLTGIRAEDAIGKSLREVFPDRPWRRRAEVAYRNVLRTHQPHTFVNDFDIDGRHYVFEISAYPSRNGISVFVKDISERKQIEDARREAEEERSALLEEAPVDIVHTDLKGKITYVNQRFESESGYSREEVIGKSGFQMDWFPAGTLELLAERMVARLRGSPAKHWETRFKRKDGRWIWVELEGKILERSAVPVGFQIIATNITERKQAEEALRRSEERYRTILEEMEDSYFEVDLGGHLTFVNNSVCRDLGYSREELLGKSYKDFMAKEDIESVFRVFNEVYRTGVPNKGFAWQTVRKDGTHGFAETSISLLKNDKGETIGFRGVGRDVTERRQAEEKLKESEQKYRLLFETSPDCITQLDTEGRYLAANPATARSLGIPLEELIGKTVFQVMPQEIAQLRLGNMRRVLDEGHPQVFEDERAGRYFHHVVLPLKISDQKQGVQVITRDITERKLAEEALRRSEERYRTILEEMEDSYFEVDLGGHVTFLNNSLCRDLGYSREELMGKSYKAFTAEEDIESVFRVFNEVYRTGVPNKGFAWKTVRKDGTHGFAETSISLLRNDEGETIGFRGVGRDIADRKQAEERLRQSEENYKTLFNSSVIGMYVLDVETMKVVMGNQAAREMAGFGSDGNGIGINPLDFVIPEDREQVFEIATKEFEQDLRRTHEVRVVARDGGVGWISISAARIMHKGRLAALVSFVDITERKRMEEALRQSEENYRALFDSSVIGTFVLDAQTMTVMIGNEAAARILGLPSTEEAVGTNLLDFIPSEDKDTVLEIIVKELFEQDLRRTHQLQAITNDGRKIWVSMTGARIIHGGRLAGLISFADITEQKRQNERLMMTDRLASIGELAAGAAHELNNPLTSIIGFSELLMEKDTPEHIRKDLAIIRSEAQRAVNVTSNLLTFARKHRPVKQLTQVNDVIEDVLKLRAYAHKSNCIEVDRHLASDLPEIPLDRFQMQQVFLNIVINAEYFMTQAHKKGTLTITTKRQNSSVAVSFADDGPGIPAENLGRIFDPFFTTKEAGKGTGLGLSICHGIVSEHGGQIYATSQPGKGATIFVELPISGNNRVEVTL